LIVVPYYPIDDASLGRIARLKLDQVGKRLMENYRASFHYSGELVEAIADRCTEVESGARNIDHILTGTLLPEISTKLLARMATGEPIQSISVTIDSNDGVQYEIA
jgi:type VI secretion system protein VasG